MSPSSNRSPSPISGRSNQNIKSPNGSNFCRKSFNGEIAARPRNFNPITPANSPASQDFNSRKMRASFEKENEKDQNGSNQIRVKSPVILKGTKSFMAPTISAASKIAASPKKKVLSDRNETVRSSTFSSSKPLFASVDSSENEEVLSKAKTVINPPLSDIPKLSKASALEFSETEKIKTKSEMGPDQVLSEALKISKLEEGLDSKVLLDNPKLPECSSDSHIENSNDNDNPLGLLVNPIFSSSSSLRSPTDYGAIRPYDPKINYLSPRPQFLRYKPNPRTQAYINEDEGFSPDVGKTLEERFTSESSSDAEQFEETSQHSDEQAFEGSLNSESYSDTEQLEEASEDSEHYETMFKHGEEETDISKSAAENKNTHDTKRSNSLFSRVPKLRVLILVLAIACFSGYITDSPFLEPSYLPENPSFAEIYVKVNEHLEWVGNNFQQWSINSIVYLSKAVPVFGKEDFDRFSVANVTALDRKFCYPEEIIADQSQLIDFADAYARAMKEQSTPQLQKEEQIKEELNQLNEEEGCLINVDLIDPEAKVTEEKNSVNLEENFKREEDHLESDDLGDNEEEITPEQTVGLNQLNEEEGCLINVDLIGPEAKVMEQQNSVNLGEKFKKEEDHLESDDLGDNEEVIQEQTVGQLKHETVELKEEDVPLEYKTEEKIEQCVEKVKDEAEVNVKVKEEDVPLEYESVEKIETVAVEEGSQILLEVEQTPTGVQVVQEEEIQENVTAYFPADSTTDESFAGIVAKNSDSMNSVSSSDMFSVKIVLPSSLAAVALLGLLYSFYNNQKKASVYTTISKEISSSEKLAASSPSAKSDSQPHFERSRIWPVEVELVGESCPSEMSSSVQMGSSYSYRRLDKRNNETRSSETKLRRNSMVSDYSTESPSYGSFTTYEKLQSKQVLKGQCGDDNISLTPVRRSSRIKQKITSP